MLEMNSYISINTQSKRTNPPTKIKIVKIGWDKNVLLLNLIKSYLEYRQRNLESEGIRKEKRKKKKPQGKANQKEIFMSIDFFDQKIIAGNLQKSIVSFLKDQISGICNNYKVVYTFNIDWRYVKQKLTEPNEEILTQFSY